MAHPRHANQASPRERRSRWSEIRGPDRTHAWDGLKRLRTLRENGPTLGQYGYDAAGERLLQRTQDGSRLTIRGGGAVLNSEFTWSDAPPGWVLAKPHVPGPDGELASVGYGAEAGVT